MDLMFPAQPLIDLAIVFVGVTVFLLLWRLRAYWWRPYRLRRELGEDPVRRYRGATWAWIVTGFGALVVTAAFLTLTGVLGSGPLMDRVFPQTEPEELARYIVATFELITHGASLCVISAGLTDIARTVLARTWIRRVAMAITSVMTVAGGAYALVFMFVIVWP